MAITRIARWEIIALKCGSMFGETEAGLGLFSCTYCASYRNFD